MTPLPRLEVARSEGAIGETPSLQPMLIAIIINAARSITQPISLSNACGNLLKLERWPFYLLPGGSAVDKIQRAWETFIQNGTGSNAVREVVAASWKRCQGYHIPIERGEAPLAPEAEAVRLRSEHAALITAARPALEQARFLLAQASSIIILTDPTGVVI
jgi:hypothetical protein